MKDPAYLKLGNRRITCLLFDLGDTLWMRGDKARLEAVAEENKRQCAILLQSYVPVLLEEITDYLACSTQLLTAMVQSHRLLSLQNFEIEPDPLHLTVQACQKVSLNGLNSEQLLTLFEAFRPPLTETRILLDGVRETLSTLKASGILLGCVTDRQYGGRPFRDSLDAFGLSEYFPPDAIIVSADCGKRKPHPSLFQQALQALQVQAEETAMVGDMLSRDIAGARHLNIMGIWKPKERLLRYAKEQNLAVDDPRIFSLARQEEQAMYTGKPSSYSFEQFLQPDMTISSVKELLTFLIKSL